ncbi:MAG: RdgB/HAM1 family non-canonical purine NTP pyrophosphatase [Candidatus Omnitrophota bacterium]|jgi:XTP/dITP diphosphohydrolase
MKLIVATQNKSKLKEIRHILSGVGIKIISLNELETKFNIQENGKTFFANAVKKTLPVSKIYKEDLIVGEDSGLVVKYLNGRPGVYSKRYSGKNWTYLKNNLKIIKQLEGVKQKERQAYFLCCLVLMKNGKLIKKIDGRVNGFINKEIKGKNGFGYDPIFCPVRKKLSSGVCLPKYKKTIAQLPSAVKNKISHRAFAFNKLKTHLLVRFSD